MTPLILKRAPVGDNPEDYSVLENGVVVGRLRADARGSARFGGPFPQSFCVVPPLVGEL